MWHEEDENEEESLSKVAYFIVNKITINLSLQQWWHMKHINVWNAFPNGKSGRPVYIQISKHVRMRSHNGQKGLE